MAHSDIVAECHSELWTHLKERIPFLSRRTISRSGYLKRDFGGIVGALHGLATSSNHDETVDFKTRTISNLAIALGSPDPNSEITLAESKATDLGATI
jgi:hypothetical protein